MNSPFLIVQDFLSPLLCEQILKEYKILTPNVNENGEAQKLERFTNKFNTDIVEKFKAIINQIEDKFNCTYRGLTDPLIQYFPENAKVPAEKPGCENSKYVRKKWVVYKDVDLVGFVWLKDYNDNVPIDVDNEVYGGKIEFPAFNFSLMPQRGTLVLFPAGPHFITVISPILLGDMYQIKLNVCTTTKNGGHWFYQPENFKGKWQDWLNEYM